MAHHMIFAVLISWALLLQTTVVLSASELKTRDDLTNSNEPLDEANDFHVPPAGPRGRDGRDGRDSVVPGPAGKRGAPGNVGPPGRPGHPGSSSGSVYTRWGREDCRGSSKLLYKGVMGGAHYTHPGGGSNYLCLPLHPIYDKFKAGNQGSTYIYGTEYEVHSQPDIFPKKLHNHDAPCAVCHAESRGSHLMIPARNVCPTGWTLEYKGYLMAEHYNHKGRTQYICVDGNPTARHGTPADLNGALLYFAESHCGSLPCSPYVQGKEMTCAVCTK